MGVFPPNVFNFLKPKTPLYESLPLQRRERRVRGER